jgi:hypothetical protein
MLVQYFNVRHALSLSLRLKFSLRIVLKSDTV